MSLRGAVIGFGKIGESTHVGALREAGLEVVAVVETSAERQRAAQRALPHARVFADVPSLLRAGGLDFVDICTPPHLHIEAARLALQAGVHVLCEKPMVLTREHGDALASLAHQQGLSVACVHNWTHAPILLRARHLATSGALGSLQEVDVVTSRTQPAGVAGDTHNWRVDPLKAGGGILFDHGWHGMSILLRSLGATPVTVRGKTERRRHARLAVEDSAEVWVGFEGGARGRFEATWAAAERSNEVTLRGTRGRIDVRNDTLTLWRDGQAPVTETFPDNLAAGGYQVPWTAGVAREFAREIDDASRRGTLMREALSVLRLLLGAYASAADGGPEIDVTPQQAVA